MEPLNETRQAPLGDSILTTAKVAGISAIVSLLATITGVIAFLTSPPAPVTAGEEGLEDNAASQVVNSASSMSVFISLIISMLAFYFLYRFSFLTKNSFKHNDRTQLVKALYSLAGYFRIWGVIMFIVAIFFSMAFIAGILTSLFS